MPKPLYQQAEHLHHKAMNKNRLWDEALGQEEDFRAGDTADARLIPVGKMPCAEQLGEVSAPLPTALPHSIGLQVWNDVFEFPDMGPMDSPKFLVNQTWCFIRTKWLCVFSCGLTCGGWSSETQFLAHGSSTRYSSGGGTAGVQFGFGCHEASANQSQSLPKTMDGALRPSCGSKMRSSGWTWEF